MTTIPMMTLLLIDDKPGNIFAMEQLLEKPDRSFLSASNGQEGLKLALNNEVDLIILDVQMPDMDGFEVAQILKSNKRTRDIPIIFASAEKIERQSVMKGFEEGAVDYLSKPLDPELTKAKVSVLLKIQLQKKELIEKNNSLERAEGQIKQLNDDLSKNLEQLQLTNKELESFSYSVSHDLRAPLRALHGHSDILKEELENSDNEDIKQSIDAIQRSAIKMDTMISDLLEFSQLGRASLKKRIVDMEELVHQIILDVVQQNLQSNIVIHELPSIHADPSLLIHVWTNLISNAVKYSSKNEKPAIELGAYLEGDECIYFVKDNGAGFDMNYAHKLFGVFQRLHKTTDFEGIGVGLAIVQRIVARHGGRVWAEGQVNAGATFYFSMPVAIPDEEQA